MCLVKNSFRFSRVIEAAKESVRAAGGWSSQVRSTIISYCLLLKDLYSLCVP